MIREIDQKEKVYLEGVDAKLLVNKKIVEDGISQDKSVIGGLWGAGMLGLVGIEGILWNRRRRLRTEAEGDNSLSLWEKVKDRFEEKIDDIRWHLR